MRPFRRGDGLTFLVLALYGCSAGPPPSIQPASPQSPATGAQPPSATNPPTDTGFSRIISGAADSVGARPGSAESAYQYRFRQVEPPSDRFSFQDRDLSFYFRPAPDVLYFQVENRQDRTVWVEWDRSTFITPFGREDRVGTAETRWENRLTAQGPTQIAGLQRYSNYLFPMNYLLDPAGSPQQLRRRLLPEDSNAPSYIDRAFGVNLVFRVDDRLVPYRFMFRVLSVSPK